MHQTSNRTLGKAGDYTFTVFFYLAAGLIFACALVGALCER
jgi:hypothetical protein